MRAGRVLLALAVVLALGFIASPGALALDSSVRELERGLPEEARDVLSGQSIDETLDVSGALGRLWDKVLGAIGGIFRAGVATSVTMLAAALLCSAAAPLSRDGGVDYVELAGVAAVLTAGVGGIRSLISEASAVVSELADFSALLLPVMASAAAASGAPASAAAKYSAATLFINLLTTLGRRLILPLIWMYIAAGAGDAAFGGSGGVAKLLSKAVTRLLTLAALAFTIYITATGLIASSADAAAVKLTKTAISTLLPVVGGMVSDAADAVVSGVGVIRGAAGAVGVVAVLSVCLLPFLKLAVNSALFRAAASVAETIAQPRLTKLIETLANACTLTLALAGTHAAMLMVAIIVTAKAAGG